MRVSYALGAAVLCGFAGTAAADTTDVTWQTKVVLEKQGEHCVDDPNCFNRYHPAIPPAARAKPGDMIVLHTRDALDSDLNLDSVADDLAAVDLNLVHPMTGPVHIEGAERGDVIAVTLVDIEPDQYGYTVIVPGFGFLRDLYTEPYLVNWKQSRTHAVSDQMPGVKVPYEAFMGSVGVLPGQPEVESWLAREAALGAAGGIALPPQPVGALPSAVCGPEGPHKDECLRTIPPRENGGNMDVQQMQVGTTLLLPCFVDGCGLFAGDVHYAQGDGEVSGTAIETGAVVTLSVEIRKGQGSVITGPEVEGGTQIKEIEPSKFYQTIGLPLKAAGEVPPPHAYLESEKIADLTNLSEDLVVAARNALIKMIAYIQREHGLNREQAYILASVAVDLRIGQVVDVPNYIVTAVLNEDVFEE
ncbi:acetamidase/formamidase family protein [Pelagibius sp.]|uniref:acetamidase/formamidase family protein n=1 Tax=Pelagibius sp. TaxID=1931238 RepID=UPI0026271304|nr:acetamidase/formamidase family protein [Pelagibius sp.]